MVLVLMFFSYLVSRMWVVDLVGCWFILFWIRLLIFLCYLKMVFSIWWWRLLFVRWEKLLFVGCLYGIFVKCVLVYMKRLWILLLLGLCGILFFKWDGFCFEWVDDCEVKLVDGIVYFMDRVFKFLCLMVEVLIDELVEI